MCLSVCVCVGGGGGDALNIITANYYNVFIAGESRL